MKPFRMAFLFFFVACSCFCVYNFTVMMPELSVTPVERSEACSARPNASQLMSQQVSVVYILLGQRKTYFKKFPVQDLDPEDRQLFAVEKAYRQAWEAAGVVSVMSEDATFVISKQQNPRLLDLCTEYPRHQVFNHLGFVQPITVKSQLAAAARRFAARAKWRAREISSLMPASYILRNPRDCHEFRDQVMSAMWIHKKDRTHNSQGVRLLTSQEAQGFAQSCGNESSRGLVQRYLPDPLLIHDRKCDFRIFLYIPSSVPLVAFSSPVWYMRCGHEKFNLSSTDPQNVVTNTKVNGKLRKGANYSELVLGPKQVQAILSARGFDSDFVEVKLAAKIKQKLTLLMEVLESQAAHLGSTTGYELLGVDMMLTSDLNLWLIEVNSSPGMESSLGSRQTAVEYMLPLVVGAQHTTSSADTTNSDTGLGLTGPLAAVVVSRGTIVLSSTEDLANNVAVQQSLKRALARVAGGVAESAVTLLWACLSGGSLVTSRLRQLASVVTLCFEIEVIDEADGIHVCTKLMRVSGAGIESVIAEELAKTDAKVTVRVVEWSPDPNPLTLSPTAQTLEAKVPRVPADGPIKVPSLGP